MRPLKIAFLSRWYAEENRRHGALGGGAIQQLAEAVAALGHEIVVLSQSPSATELEQTRVGVLETWLSPRDCKRDFLTGLRDKLAKGKYGHRKVYSDAYSLRDFLNRRGPFDVLWVQGEEPDGLIAGIAAGLGIALPPIMTQIHSLRYRFHNGAPEFNSKPALRLAFRHAARIIANSDLVARSLAAYAAPDLTVDQLQARTHVVHPNLQHEFLRAAQETDAAPPAEPGRVLFLGALNEKKGALVFAEAILKTKVLSMGATFAVVGGLTEKNLRFTQSWNKAVEAVRASSLPAQFELLGKLTATEVIRHIQRASLVVLPSLFDEFSRALVEALILGRPVVTTRNVGAWPLVNQHNCGLVVEPGDSEALALAIDDALNPESPYAANAAMIAHRLIHEFSPEALALQISRHLEEIALQKI